MENKFEIGDKFTLKGSRDSNVMSIERIYNHFGQEPKYEMKPIGFSGGRCMISESTLNNLYNKL